MTFATIERLKLRWQEFPQDLPDEVAEIKLEDASAWLSVRYSVPDSPSANQSSVLEMVTCSLVRRSLSNVGKEDVASESETYGQFKYSKSYVDRGGEDMYLTKQEKELLDKAFRVGKRSGSLAV